MEEGLTLGRRLTRVIVTPTGVTSALIFNFSSVMPETTGWAVDHLPKWPKQEGQWRILIVTGNVAHFAGDMPLVFWPLLLNCGHWEHVIYVPGLYDYGSGTLQLGDEYLAVLEKFDSRLTVFGPKCDTKALFLTGPALLVVGAPCFPSTVGSYVDAHVYERRGTESDLNAVTEEHAVLAATAAQRLDADVAMLLATLEREALPQPFTRVIVTHGCPDEVLAAERKRSPFAATVKLGNKRIYRCFAQLAVKYWFCGAPTDKPVAKMDESPTLLCSNCFVPSLRALPTHDCFIVKGPPQ